MVFGVVVFGPNSCEKVVSQSNVNQNTEHGCYLQKVHLHIHSIHQIQDNNKAFYVYLLVGTSPLKKSVKANCIISSADKSGITRSGYPYFVSTIKPDCLSNFRFYIPITFARENGLDRNEEIVLRDAMQRSWTIGLNNSGKQVIISRGWSEFHKENNLKLGDSIFELIRKGQRPIANFVPTNFGKL